MKKLVKLFIFLSLCGLIFLNSNRITATEGSGKLTERAILIVVADKIESNEFLASTSGNIQQLVQESAIGLLNVRSASGYYNSDSGYLTLGTGSRSIAKVNRGINLKTGRLAKQPETGSVWSWSINTENISQADLLVVPEIGLLINQAEEDAVKPGLLGTLLQKNGWKTVLIGNQDNSFKPNRPGALIIMNQAGIIDTGNVGAAVTRSDPSFPYLYRTNLEKVRMELAENVKPGNIVLLDFGDFARLDQYREEILLEQYNKLKADVWREFDSLIGFILQGLPSRKLDLIILSPSISKEGQQQKNLLSVMVIKSDQIKPGLLRSGTTNWTGLVANLDFLPTVLRLAAVDNDRFTTGRPIFSVPCEEKIEQLQKINQKIVTSVYNQRTLLDWYLGLITFGWLIALAGIFISRHELGDWVLTFVAVSPLSLLLMPLLPLSLWQLSGFILLNITFSLIFKLIRNLDQRYLWLAGILWSSLIIDQILGWNLIRFSGLGYSSVAGSRYYGMGNEYMGVFLAAGLIFAFQLFRITANKLIVAFILAFTAFTLAWPAWGINFGGTLAALFGFSYYLIRLYQVKFTNIRLWLVSGGTAVIMALFGWWDSNRNPEVQTHVGRFLKNLFHDNQAEAWVIITRKLEMNLKLLIFSPWARIILLALIIAIVNRIFLKRSWENIAEVVLWQAILITGLAAFLLNDSGVLAFGTCLAFGYSYALSKWNNIQHPMFNVQGSKLNSEKVD